LHRIKSPSHSKPSQFRWISKDFIYVRTLKIAYIAKAIIATILIVLAIAFAVALYTSNNTGGMKSLRILYEALILFKLSWNGSLRLASRFIFSRSFMTLNNGKACTRAN
jgi:hypothetical protein